MASFGFFCGDDAETSDSSSGQRVSDTQASFLGGSPLEKLLKHGTGVGTGNKSRILAFSNQDLQLFSSSKKLQYRIIYFMSPWHRGYEE
jgi:hypothetical protein